MSVIKHLWALRVLADRKIVTRWLALVDVAEAAQRAVDAAGTHNWPVNCDALRAALVRLDDAS